MIECWLCEASLNENEIQYCAGCELAMLKEILGEEQHENIHGEN